MPYRSSIDRCLRRRLHTTTALVSLALWIIMAAAEICTPLHAWLHGGSIPDDDDCAIAILAHGKVETSIGGAPAVAPVAWIEISPRIELSVFHPVMAFLANNRGPPALPALS